jgi:hypothetical protein
LNTISAATPARHAPAGSTELPASPRLTRAALALSVVYLVAVATSPLWLPDVRLTGWRAPANCAAADPRSRCGAIGDGSGAARTAATANSSRLSR